MIQLKKCHNKPYCKSNEEIERFMADKYLLVLNNQIRFDANSYANESIKGESTTGWVKILSKGHRTIPMRVTKSDIDLQDGYINLDQATEI